jgi:hypothetical protein
VTTAVEFRDVSLAELDRDRICHFSLSRPLPGRPEPLTGPYAFEIEGSVLGRKQPVTAIDLRMDGDQVKQVPVNKRNPQLREEHPESANADVNGFRRSISALYFAPEFELSIEAVFADDSRVEVGRLRGSRAPLPSGPEGQLQPLMLTTLGRSGSTAVINLLAGHPQVVAYNPSWTETRVATYWISAFLAMAEPASYMRQVFPRGLSRDRLWWLGRGEPESRLEEDPATRQWLGSQSVEELAGLCRDRIESFYGQLAARTGRTTAPYFMEKSAAGPVPGLLDELYPNSREIVLVRDFRDMFCSMLSYEDGRGFGPPPGTTYDEHVATIGQRVDELRGYWRRRQQRALLVRYEDLVTNPDEVIERLLAFLDLDGNSLAASEMATRLAESRRALAHHRTTGTPEDSIGRWRRDLDPDRLELVEHAFRPALDAFGYS